MRTVLYHIFFSFYRQAPFESRRAHFWWWLSCRIETKHQELVIPWTPEVDQWFKKILLEAECSRGALAVVMSDESVEWMLHALHCTSQESCCCGDTKPLVGYVKRRWLR